MSQFPQQPYYPPGTQPPQYPGVPQQGVQPVLRTVVYPDGSVQQVWVYPNGAVLHPNGVIRKNINCAECADKIEYPNGGYGGGYGQT